MLNFFWCVKDVRSTIIDACQKKPSLGEHAIQMVDLETSASSEAVATSSASTGYCSKVMNGLLLFGANVGNSIKSAAVYLLILSEIFANITSIGQESYDTIFLRATLGLTIVGLINTVYGMYRKAIHTDALLESLEILIYMYSAVRDRFGFPDQEPILLALGIAISLALLARYDVDRNFLENLLATTAHHPITSLPIEKNRVARTASCLKNIMRPVVRLLHGVIYLAFVAEVTRRFLESSSPFLREGNKILCFSFAQFFGLILGLLSFVRGPAEMKLSFNTDPHKLEKSYLYKITRAMNTVFAFELVAMQGIYLAPQLYYMFSNIFLGTPISELNFDIYTPKNALPLFILAGVVGLACAKDAYDFMEKLFTAYIPFSLSFKLIFQRFKTSESSGQQTRDFNTLAQGYSLKKKEMSLFQLYNDSNLGHQNEDALELDDENSDGNNVGQALI